MLPLSQQTLELLLVRGGHVGLGVEPPLLLLGLLLQHVVVARTPALDPALLAHLEAPSGTLVGLHLRHFSSTFRRVYLYAKRLAAREKGPFRLYLSQASVSKCCLSASGPLPASVRLGVLRLHLWALRLSGFLLRCHDHHHVPAVQVGLALYAPQFVEVACEPPQEPLSQLGMLDLAAAEHYRDLHLVTTPQKALDVATLGIEVVVTYLGPELDLPHVDVDLLLAGGLAGLLFLVLELAVVHHADHGRVGVGGYFHEVQVSPLTVIHSLADVLDT